MLLLPNLETKRLRLRQLSLKDETLIQKYASDRKIADTTISIPHPYPDDGAKQYIQQKIAEFTTGYSITLAIESKLKHKLIGVIDRILQKNGFQSEGLLRQRVRKWGIFEDVMLLSILRQDWQSNKY